MIRHIVLFRFVPGTTAEQVEAIAQGVRGLASIPGVSAISCGPDAGLVEGNADFASVVDLDDEAAYLAYVGHPEHQRLLAERIRPVLAERTAVQYRPAG